MIDIRIFQHRTLCFIMLYIKLWTHTTGWIFSSFKTRDWIFIQSLFGAPYCSGWGNHCSVFFFQNPTKQCMSRSWDDLWCSESHKAALELRVCSVNPAVVTEMETSIHWAKETMVIQVGHPAWYRSLKFIQQQQHRGKDEQLSNTFKLEEQPWQEKQ